MLPLSVLYRCYRQSVILKITPAGQGVMTKRKAVEMSEAKLKAPKRTTRMRSQLLERLTSEHTLLPTLGVFCLLTFCFVSFSQKLPLGFLAAAGAIAVAALRGGQFVIPRFFRWYLAYVAIGAIGWFTTPYPNLVSDELLGVFKIALIGIAAFNIIDSPRAGRTFVVWYLALFMLFPVRGALYNYIHGITEGGRIAWNFFFRNPNDLAMTCFLPLGLCAYEMFVEENKWARSCACVGVGVITGIQMLTQSRGAMLALGGGILYYAMRTERKVRTLIMIGALCAAAAAAAPSGVWDRVAGLSNLASGDMSKVDQDGSAAGRSTLMHLAWKIAMNNPEVGVGIGAYAPANARIAQWDPSVGRDERGERDAHSTYIRAAAETGLAGGVCVLLTVLTSIAFCRANRKKAQKRDPYGRDALALLALEASLVAYALGAIVNSAERSTYFVLQFVIPCALAAVIAHEKSPGDRNAVDRAPRRGPVRRGRAPATIGVPHQSSVARELPLDPSSASLTEGR
jgi:O-antigen ligase